MPPELQSEKVGTPAVKEAGLYREYSRLYDIVNSYNRAIAMGSQTAAGKLEKIKQLIKKTGMGTDFNVTDLDEDALERIEHYLLEIRESFMPYGLHTFGQSLDGETLHDTIKTIAKSNRSAEQEDVKKWLIDSGPREIDHLLRGLNGGYIPLIKKESEQSPDTLIAMRRVPGRVGLEDVARLSSER